MMTNWVHANDSMQALFLARILILAAAIGLGILVFGLGALVVRGLDAARLWSARRALACPPNCAVRWPAPTSSKT
jgi:hypothetical protein